MDFFGAFIRLSKTAIAASPIASSITAPASASPTVRSARLKPESPVFSTGVAASGVSTGMSVILTAASAVSRVGSGVGAAVGSSVGSGVGSSVGSAVGSGVGVSLGRLNDSEAGSMFSNMSLTPESFPTAVNTSPNFSRLHSFWLSQIWYHRRCD